MNSDLLLSYAHRIILLKIKIIQQALRIKILTEKK